ncbi:triple gene block protein 3 [Pseudostellaria heterophylla carlavirus 2]|uniref:Movement protein TGBp3 n=1 Tax=Pseudostellaria heterophylla carlavirus 2 TaxID=2982811 RepID=A0A977TNN5_9VIRU|nr:triple gene block protein 3 [Pseudostellaria heterophylla carlavirus 2]
MQPVWKSPLLIGVCTFIFCFIVLRVLDSGGQADICQIILTGESLKILNCQVNEHLVQITKNLKIPPLPESLEL